MDPVLEELLGEHHFFLRRDTAEAGLTDKVLYRLLRDGVLRRVRHGAYTSSAHWRSLSPSARHVLRARCVVRSAGVQVALSHTTAALVHGAPVWDLSLADVHLVRLDRRTGRREAGVRQHGHLLDEDDVVEIGGLPVTAAARTCLDITTIARTEAALCMLDHFLHVGATTQQELVRRAGTMGARPGSLAADLVCRLADGRSESVGESRLRYRCWLSHLPHPVPQYEIVERGRVVYRLDLAWPELGLWVEFDGKEKYLRHRRPGESVVDAVLREKRREERIARMTGWRCLRITWADLYDPDRVVALIAAVLEGGPVYV